MNYKEYLKHLSIVILGILVAFWINNLGISYKEHRTQKQIYSTILNELKNNNEKIKSSMQNLDSLHINFTKLQNKNYSSNLMGVRIIEFSAQSTGYEIAKYTGILKDLNHKLASEIVENYQLQNSIKELYKILVDEFLNIIKDGINKKDNIQYLLLQIENLKINLENLDKDQKQLTEHLTKFLGKS